VFGQRVWKNVRFGVLDSYIKFLFLAQPPHVHGILTSSCLGQATAVGADAHLECALLGHFA
jgi:hypothetical protein